MDGARQQYVDTHSKSQILGFVLAFFLGPLGLFYSSWAAALILFVVALATFSTVLGPIVCWLISMIISVVTVHWHNEKVKAAAGLMMAK